MLRKNIEINPYMMREDYTISQRHQELQSLLILEGKKSKSEWAKYL